VTIYDVQAGRPQLRIENRVLSSGPTAVDMVANAAFYYGLVRAIVDSDPAPRGQMPCVDHPVDQLTCEVLLPAAAAGLDAWGWTRTTATGTSVSLKRGFDAVVPVLSGRPGRCATSRNTGWSASRRCVR